MIRASAKRNYSPTPSTAPQFIEYNAIKESEGGGISVDERLAIAVFDGVTAAFNACKALRMM